MLFETCKILRHMTEQDGDDITGRCKQRYEERSSDRHAQLREEIIKE